MLGAGELNRQITIQIAQKTRDAAGAETLTWATFASGVWSRIKPTSGNERYINQQMIAEVTHEITIRYRYGIKPTMRILYGRRTFDILAMHDVDEGHYEIRLICKELV